MKKILFGLLFYLSIVSLCYGQGVKISDLPLFTSGFTSDAYLPISKGGVTYKTALNNLLTSTSLGSFNTKFTGNDTFTHNTILNGATINDALNCNGTAYFNGNIGGNDFPSFNNTWGWNSDGSNGHFGLSYDINWDVNFRLSSKYFYAHQGLYAPGDTCLLYTSDAADE